MVRFFYKHLSLAKPVKLPLWDVIFTTLSQMSFLNLTTTEALYVNDIKVGRVPITKTAAVKMQFLPNKDALPADSATSAESLMRAFTVRYSSGVIPWDC